jgi:hypothetical protein
MKKLLLLIFAFSLSFAALAADSFSTFEERMSGKEFKAAGLNKLTAEELSTLNEWARRHSVATLENAAGGQTGGPGTAASDDMRGFEDQPKDELDKIVNGTIDGTFNGSTGKGALFKLTNGMVWQQTEKDSFYVEPVENAKVTIEKSMMGRWYLSLVGQKKKVRVERIQ